MLQSPSGPSEAPEDADLVARARQGDRRAFDELVRRYSRRVFGLVLRWVKDADDAEEIAQEAFIRAWRALPKFEGGAEFRAWLFRIAVNTATDELRARKRRRSVPLDDVSESELGAAPAEDPAETLQGERLGERLERAMARLSDEHRLILLLRAREEMSYEEIAHTLAVPKGTVMSRLARARTQLKALLDQESTP